MWSGHLTKWDGRPPCDVATPSDAIPIPNLLEEPMHPFLRAVARAATLGGLALTLSFAVMTPTRPIELVYVPRIWPAFAVSSGIALILWRLKEHSAVMLIMHNW